MNPNHKPTPILSPIPSPNATPGKRYDVETIITAEIDIMHCRDVGLPDDADWESYKERTAKKFETLIKMTTVGLLKGPDIKVQVFLHEKTDEKE